MCVQGVWELPAGGGGLGASTPRYFSILLFSILLFSILILAGCWLPRWELFVGLKPRSARDMANPPVPETTFSKRFLPHSHLCFHFSLPALLGREGSQKPGEDGDVNCMGRGRNLAVPGQTQHGLAAICTPLWIPAPRVCWWFNSSSARLTQSQV